MRSGPRVRPVGSRVAVGVVLVAVLLAAGCSGFAGSVESEPTPTVSPAPIPTAGAGDSTDRRTATTGPGDDRTIAAPGVSVVDGGARVNATRLGRAHEFALDRAGSYRRTVSLTIRTEDGSVVVRDRETVLADRDTGRYRIEETPRLAPGPFDEPAAYERFVANGTRHTYRRFVNGTTRIDRSAAASPPRGRWRVDGRALAARLSRADLRPASLGDDGAPGRYVLAGRVSDPPESGLVSDPADGRMVATVHADGLIREIRMSYRARSGRQPIAVVLVIKHDRLGRTAVDRPAWLDGAPTDGSLTSADQARTRTERTLAANGSAGRGAQSPPGSSSSRVRRWR